MGNKEEMEHMENKEQEDRLKPNCFICYIKCKRSEAQSQNRYFQIGNKTFNYIVSIRNTL